MDRRAVGRADAHAATTGAAILGYRGRFDAERAFALLEKYDVRNAFLFPTALKMMMKAVPQPRERFDLRLRSLMSGGEARRPRGLPLGAARSSASP